MTTSNVDIQRLIDRFMSGQTTLSEEARLAEFFRTHDVPREWADYKAMFAYFDAGMPVGEPSGRGKAAVIATKPWWRKASRWAAAAAVVVAVGAAALHLGLTGGGNAGVPQKAAVAKAAATEPESSIQMAAAAVHACADAPHIAQAVKVKDKAQRRHRTQASTEYVATPEGVAEYSDMVVAADYDQWVSIQKSDLNTQQAMALMEQGAAAAVMCNADGSDVPEVP